MLCAAIPANVDFLASQVEFTLGLPRLVRAWSRMSSWSRLAVWIISLTSATCLCFPSTCNVNFKPLENCLCCVDIISNWILGPPLSGCHHPIGTKYNLLSFHSQDCTNSGCVPYLRIRCNTSCLKSCLAKANCYHRSDCFSSAIKVIPEH